MSTAVPWVLTGVTVLAQIAWILFPAGGRTAVTTVVVVGFAGAAIAHAAVWCGVRWAGAFAAVCLVFGVAIEVLGSRTGFPFGSYGYSESLQPQVLGVPVVVPLAWMMMAYPCLVLARAVSTRWRIPLAALGLATWDLFLDPQMVGEGYWIWSSPTPALPGIPGIPLTNYLGWLVGALVLMAVLDRLPAVEVPLGVPMTMYGWMWLGGVVANLVFLGRPAVALIGGIGMASLGVPAARTWWAAR